MSRSRDRVHIALLTSKGLAIAVDTLKALYNPADYAKLLKRCTLCYRPKIGKPVIVKLHREVVRALPDGTDQTVLYLPRGAIDELTARGATIRCTMTPVAAIEPGPFFCELFPNQEIIVARLLEEFTAERQLAGTATALLNLRAGMGKTFVAAAVVHRVRLPTLFVTITDYLAEQAVKDFKGCFQADLIRRWDREANRRAHARQKKEAGVAGGGGTSSAPAPVTARLRDGTPLITVIVINSALLEPPEFFGQFGMVVFDEVHMMCADKRKTVFERTTWCAWGMSATTEQRNDTFDSVAWWHLAGFEAAGTPTPTPRIIRGENVPGFSLDDVQFTGRVTVLKYAGPPEHTHVLKHPSTEKMFTPWMNKQFLADDCRTQVMLGELKRLYDWTGDAGQRHRIFVFCEEREPLIALLELLGGLFDVDAPELHDQVGHFIGGTKAGEVARVKRDARVILTTYGYSSTGVSIVDMTAIVFWTPRRSNMMQILPRVMRRGGDVSICREFIDLVDWSTPMKSQFYERRNAYHYYGLSIEEVNCGPGWATKRAKGNRSIKAADQPLRIAEGRPSS